MYGQLLRFKAQANTTTQKTIYNVLQPVETRQQFYILTFNILSSVVVICI